MKTITTDVRHLRSVPTSLIKFNALFCNSSVTLQDDFESIFDEGINLNELVTVEYGADHVPHTDGRRSNLYHHPFNSIKFKLDGVIFGDSVETVDELTTIINQLDLEN